MPATTTIRNSKGTAIYVNTGTSGAFVKLVNHSTDVSTPADKVAKIKITNHGTLGTANEYINGLSDPQSTTVSALYNQVDYAACIALKGSPQTFNIVDMFGNEDEIDGNDISDGIQTQFPGFVADVMFSAGDPETPATMTVEIEQTGPATVVVPV